MNQEESGLWKDTWSAKAIMQQQSYTRSDGVTVSVRSIQEKANAVYFELCIDGMNHWGDEFDLRAIEKHYNHGFIMFHSSIGSNVFWKRPNEAYSLAYSRYSFIEGDGNVHFRAAGIVTAGGILVQNIVSKEHFPL